MSNYPYIGQLSPTVGNGLGGLPRRESAAVKEVANYFAMVDNLNYNSSDGMFFNFTQTEKNILSGKSKDSAAVYISPLDRYSGFNYKAADVVSDVTSGHLARDDNYCYLPYGEGTNQYVVAFDLAEQKHRRYLYNGSGARTYVDTCAVVLPDKTFMFVGGSQHVADNAVLTKVNMDTDAVVFKNRYSTNNFSGIISIGVTSDARLFAFIRELSSPTQTHIVELSTSTGERIASTASSPMQSGTQNPNKNHMVVANGFIVAVTYSATNQTRIHVHSLDLTKRRYKDVATTIETSHLVTKGHGRVFVVIAGVGVSTTNKVYEVTDTELILVATTTGVAIQNDMSGIDYDDTNNVLVLRMSGIYMQINPDSPPATFTLNGVTWTDESRAVESWSINDTVVPVTTALNPVTDGAGYTFTITTSLAQIAMDDINSEIPL